MSEQSMRPERIDTEAVAARWLQQCGPCDAGLPTGCSHPDEDYRPVMAALVEELERTRRGARTLGHIIESNGRAILDITGCHDFIDADGDGDWGAVWDHLYELPAKALRQAADEMEAVIANGDCAEVAAHVPGEVGRSTVVARRDALYEEPHEWLRDYATRTAMRASDPTPTR